MYFYLLFSVVILFTSCKKDGETHIVTNRESNRDGENYLKQIEKIQFNDQTIEL